MVVCGSDERAFMTRPNIVTIIADDLPRRMFTRKFFPKTFSRLVDRGTSYPDGFHAVPVCDPSRVSFLTGRWVHNHGVLDNTDAVMRSRETGPTGTPSQPA